MESLADILSMLTFFYLTAAVLQRRQATWLVGVVTVVAFAALRLQSFGALGALVLLDAGTVLGDQRHFVLLLGTPLDLLVPVGLFLSPTRGSSGS